MSAGVCFREKGRLHFVEEALTPTISLFSIFAKVGAQTLSWIADFCAYLTDKDSWRQTGLSYLNPLDQCCVDGHAPHSAPARRPPPPRKTFLQVFSMLNSWTLLKIGGGYV